jgi:OOP family OmpA-OmpF porin
MKRIVFILIIGCCQRAAAQYGYNARDLADRAFNKRDYYEAAFYYKKAADGIKTDDRGQIPYQANNPASNKHDSKSSGPTYIMYRLAESYRLYENYTEAAGWYYKVINGNQSSAYPIARLWYGVCLRATQHFDMAIDQLEIFNRAYKGDSKYNTIALREIANCRFANEQYQYPLLFNVTKLTGQWNSNGSNYAIAAADNNSNNYWFTSSRLVKDDNRHLNKIYYTADISSMPQMVDLNFPDNKKENEYGTPSLCLSGRRMYFTRWYKEGSKTIYAIYCSDRSANGWASPRKLNAYVDADGFNTIQPYVTADGSKLFFASTKPGGQGGYDIWMSDLDSNGNPLNSTNLGSSVNTLFDEQAPYYDEALQRLLYSSKGFTGLGGFDFFESFGNTGDWTKPRNLGFPINSAKDDIYYQPNHLDKNKFYISSDRESECCLDLFEVTNHSLSIAASVVDCDTNRPITGVTVSLVDSLNRQVLNTLTVNRDGKYTFRVTDRRPRSLRIEKAGYATKVIPVNTLTNASQDTLLSPEICLQSTVKVKPIAPPVVVNKPEIPAVGKPVILKDVLFDFNKATLRPETKKALDYVVKLMLDNPTFKIELAAYTDAIGGKAYNLKLSQARAQACVNYIVSKGVNRAQIIAKGYGSAKPIAPNKLPNGKDNPEGRQLNRRTEFTIVKK